MLKRVSPRSRSRISVAAFSLLLCLLGTSCSWYKTRDYYMRSAKRYADDGQLREAAIQYLNAIRLDPRYAKAHHELGHVALRLGDPRTAEMELGQAVQLDQEDTELRVDYANALFSNGKIDEAEREARAVLSKSPDNAHAHIVLAQVHGARNDAISALHEAEAAVKPKDNDAQVYITLAGAHLKLREYAQGESVLKKALQENPNNTELIMALGELYLAEGKFDLSEATFLQAIASNKKDPQPRVRLLNQYVSLKQWDKGRALALQAKADNPKDPLSYRMYADFLLWKGDMSAALDEYGSLVKQHPADYQMARAYVQLLLFADRVDEAETLNKRVMKQFGSDPMSLIARGEILVRKGDPSSAIPVLKKALQSATNNYLAHLYLGIALQQTNDPPGAERELREAARLRPDAPGSQFLLAELGRSSRNVDLIFNSAEGLLQAFPKSASAYVLRGTAALAWKQNVSGEADFKKAIEVDPKSPVGYAALGQLRMEQGKNAEAEQLLRKAVQVDPTYAYALRQLAMLLNKLGRSTDAVAMINERIAQDPTNPNWYTIVGEIQFLGKQYPAAEASLKKATQLNQDQDYAWQLLGQAQAAQGNLDGTVATFNRWGEVSLINPTPYVILGQVHESRHDWSLAEKAYRKALERDPNNPIAANNLANGMLEHSGDPIAALSLALVAQKADPDSVIVADTIGLAYLRQHKYEQAISAFNAALRRDDRNASLHYHLSKALAESGEIALASSHYDQAKKLDPQFVASNEEREKVHEYFLNQQKKD